MKYSIYFTTVKKYAVTFFYPSSWQCIIQNNWCCNSAHVKCCSVICRFFISRAHFQKVPKGFQSAPLKCTQETVWLVTNNSSREKRTVWHGIWHMIWSCLIQWSIETAVLRDLVSNFSVNSQWSTWTIESRWLHSLAGSTVRVPLARGYHKKYFLWFFQQWL